MPAVERIILCGGVSPPPRVKREKLLSLRLGDGDDEVRLKITDITNRLASELPPILTDLVVGVARRHGGTKATTFRL
jgi:hypothetical protein